MLSPRYHVFEYKSLLLRTVPPYFSVINQYYRQEWKGLTLGELFERNFLKSHQIGVKRAVECELIKINNQPCTLDDVLKQGDVLMQTMHRHEPPVLFVDAAEMIMYDDGDVVVVNKPCTVPIHSAGAYNLNSIVCIAKEDLGMDIKPIHRLDRLVSGLVVFARESATAKRISNCLVQAHRGSYVEKAYLARVRGKFEVAQGERWRLVSIGIHTVDVKTSTYECNDELGKSSQSRFALLSYDAESDTSLLQCEPLTGRTHQLRLHLQAIGHPIVNDPIYGPDGKLPILPHTEEDLDYTNKVRAFDRPIPLDLYSAELGEEMLQACEGCKRVRRPPSPLGIWLHSMRFKVYERGEMIYEFIAKPPVWAAKDEVELLDD